MDVPCSGLDTGMDGKLGHGMPGSYLDRADTQMPHQGSVDPLVEPGGQVLR